MVKAKALPAPIRISRNRVAWDAEAVEGFIADAVALGRLHPPKGASADVT
jgi:predicted DNA-binding transcriptional regulator AlpA